MYAGRILDSHRSYKWQDLSKLSESRIVILNGIEAPLHCRCVSPPYLCICLPSLLMLRKSNKDRLNSIT